MHRFWKSLQCSLIFLVIVNFFFAIVLVLYRTLPVHNVSHIISESEQKWIATSASWIDRTACRWINICGGINWLGHTRLFYTPSDKSWPETSHKSSVTSEDWDDPDSINFPTSWTDQDCFQRDIPRCVLDNAPLVFLHSDEPYHIADPAEHLKHMVPKVNSQTMTGIQLHLNNISILNSHIGGYDVCLTSKENIDDGPPFMLAEWNDPKPYQEEPVVQEPDSSHFFHEDPNLVGQRDGWYRALPTQWPSIPPVDFHYTNWTTIRPHISKEIPGYSPAPAILITIPKANNTVDAFWFIFNSFNLGNRVLGMRFGNHVGDWEHVMVRFQNDQPKALFTSRHSFGESAYAWDALEKIGSRPVVYSARGSHAMYVTAGIHPYKLPLNMLYDETNKGTLWDPSLPGLKAYTYDVLGKQLRASSISPKAATSWFYFNGNWGDERLPLNDSRQYRFVGEYHYSTGPNGPQFKNLERSTVCESRISKCHIRNSLP